MLDAVFSVFSLILWLVVVPVSIGLLFNGLLPIVRRTVGITFMLGYMIYFAVFEVIAIPCMLYYVYNAFSHCTRYYMMVTAILAALGIIKCIRMLKRDGFTYLTLFPGETHATAHELLSPRSDPRMLKLSYSLESKIYWGIFFGLVAVQMVLAVFTSSFDGDDAYYVVESLLAQQADVMNTILPYTGMSTALDIRHALAVITMWIAFIGRMSVVHTTIVSHTIIPLLIIPFVYLIYIEIARILFRRRQEAIPVFMIIISILMMFGNVSIYTPATFFLTRTWQGKTMVSNIVFPMILWVFLWMLEDAKRIKIFGKDSELKTESYAEYDEPKAIYRAAPWIFLALINMFSGICSSMGIIFGSGLIALFTLVLLIFNRKIRVLIGAVLCVIPNLIYLYVYLKL